MYGAGVQRPCSGLALYFALCLALYLTLCPALCLPARAAGLSPEQMDAAQVNINVQEGSLSGQTLHIVREAVNAIARQAQDQDGGEVSRLRQRARQSALAALHTQGYFDAQVDLQAGPDVRANNRGDNPHGEVWHLTLQTGPRTHVSQVALTFSGAIAAPEFEARRDDLRQNWRLPVGRPFINGHWAQAKDAWLDNLRRRDFHLARLAHTQAAIHADDARAELTVQVDSGPRVRLGALKTEGLRRVPERLITRYVAYTPGDAFDQDRLDAWQQALNDTAFFRGAFVQLDSDAAHWQSGLGSGQGNGASSDEIHIPVKVRVIEAPRRQFSASLGADSDNGLRAEGLYRQNVLFGQAVRSSLGAGLDKNRNRFFYDVHLAPSRQGWRDSVGVLANHSEISGVTTTRYGLGWKRQQTRAAATDRAEYETRLGVVLAHDNTRIAGVDTYTVPTVVGTWQWLRRDVDDSRDPREGWLVDVGLGLGATLDDRSAFYRASLRAQAWWSVARRDVLTLRGEVGKVWSHTRRLPEDFGYRAGGARSLRGYKYQSVGMAQGDAVVGAPTLAVVGLEYTHYLNDTWGVAAFVDAGDAAPAFADMHWRWGWGLGARVRTPAGAFGTDVAWGQRERKLRLYFSLGLAF